MNAKSALVREALRSVLVPAGEQPVLTDSSGASSGQAPGLAHPALCDQADRDGFENQQVSLDALADTGPPRATASQTQPVPPHPQRASPLQSLRGGIRAVPHPAVPSPPPRPAPPRPAA